MSWRRWLVGWLVVTRVHCGQTVHPRPICDIYDFFAPYTNVLTYLLTYYSYYGTLIGNPTPGIQWYNFRPPGVTPNREKWAPREALFVKLLWPLVSCRYSWTGNFTELWYYCRHCDDGGCAPHRPHTLTSLIRPHRIYIRNLWQAAIEQTRTLE